MASHAFQCVSLCRIRFFYPCAQAFQAHIHLVSGFWKSNWFDGITRFDIPVFRRRFCTGIMRQRRSAGVEICNGGKAVRRAVAKMWRIVKLPGKGAVGSRARVSDCLFTGPGSGCGINTAVVVFFYRTGVIVRAKIRQMSSPVKGCVLAVHRSRFARPRHPRVVAAGWAGRRQLGRPHRQSGFKYSRSVVALWRIMSTLLDISVTLASVPYLPFPATNSWR